MPPFDIGEELIPVEKIIKQEKINSYGKVADDLNPLHIDPEFAKKTRFGGTIAHGFIPVAYISEMMVNNFGNPWFTTGRLKVTFLGPVRPEDIIRVKGNITAIEAGSPARIHCRIWCENQNMQQVIVGESSVVI